jgi:hypothetical protein
MPRISEISVVVYLSARLKREDHTLISLILIVANVPSPRLASRAYFHRIRVHDGFVALIHSNSS